MAQWQSADSGEVWDDGETSKPGEESFSRENAAQHFGGAEFNYMGTPNWAPPPEEA